MAFLIKKILNSIKNIYTEIDDLSSKLIDSGWQTASLTDNFKNYKDDPKYQPKFRKIGKTVEIQGVISPTTTIEGSDTTVPIFTLPEGYRPTQEHYMICQGTTSNKWLLTVTMDGVVAFSRYGITDFADASSSVWLPFNISYFVD